MNCEYFVLQLLFLFLLKGLCVVHLLDSFSRPLHFVPRVHTNCAVMMGRVCFVFFVVASVAAREHCCSSGNLGCWMLSWHFCHVCDSTLRKPACYQHSEDWYVYSIPAPQLCQDQGCTSFAYKCLVEYVAKIYWEFFVFFPCLYPHPCKPPCFCVFIFSDFVCKTVSCCTFFTNPVLVWDSI